MPGKLALLAFPGERWITQRGGRLVSLTPNGDEKDSLFSASTWDSPHPFCLYITTEIRDCQVFFVKKENNLKMLSR